MHDPKMKKKPPSQSTCGGSGLPPSRATASASKIAQIGPPPFRPSPTPANAAFMKLLGLYLTARAFASCQ